MWAKLFHSAWKWIFTKCFTNVSTRIRGGDTVHCILEFRHCQCFVECDEVLTKPHDIRVICSVLIKTSYCFWSIQHFQPEFLTRRWYSSSSKFQLKSGRDILPTATNFDRFYTSRNCWAIFTTWIESIFSECCGAIVLNLAAESNLLLWNSYYLNRWQAIQF